MSLITAIRQRGHLTISSALLWHKRGVSSLSRICLSNGMTLLISDFLMQQSIPEKAYSNIRFATVAGG